MEKKMFHKNWNVGTAVLMEMAPPTDLKSVTLPHDAMIEKPRTRDAASGERKGFWPEGAYKYSKQFYVPEEWKDKRIYFVFEGVYNGAVVWINDDYVLRHPNGYTEFVVSADTFLKYGRENVISVLCSSGQDSRWYTGTGIYRPVYLMTGGLVHIKPNGVKTTVLEHGGKTVLGVDTIIRNADHLKHTLTLDITIRNPQGVTVSGTKALVTVFAGEEQCSHQRITLENPELWDAEHPVLYTCEVKVVEDGVEKDCCEERFGIRCMTLSASDGLRVNGRAVKLRGACLHHDNGPVGAATFETSEYRRIKKLKEAGFNAVRMAHNPASRALLRACDDIGMYVMDEFSDVWGRGKTNTDYSLSFESCWESDVNAMVDKDYNHPCVIMYSIGNEIPDVGSPVGSAWGRKLANRFRQLDNSRYTINCINGLVGLAALGSQQAENTNEGDINQAMVDLVGQMEQIMQMEIVGTCTEESYSCVDIAGYNYMEARYEIDHDLYPERVICGSETYPPKIAKNWEIIKKSDHIIGEFTWTGWDYLGEPGIGRVSYDMSSQAYGQWPYLCAGVGDIDVLGNRRPVSYYREIVYGLSRDPYIAVRRPEHYGEAFHKMPWGWNDVVSGWTWEGYEGKRVVVEVYADAREIALFLNDREIGRQVCSEENRFLFEFDIEYHPGVLMAVAFDQGEETGRYSLATADGEMKIEVAAEEEKCEFSETGLVYFDISLADENGTCFHNRTEKVSLEVLGPGVLQGYGSADPLSTELFTDMSRTTYDGRLLAVVRPLGKGRIILRASTEDGIKSEAYVEVC